MYFKGSEECVAPPPRAMHSRPPQSWWLTGLHVSKATGGRRWQADGIISTQRNPSFLPATESRSSLRRMVTRVNFTCLNLAFSSGLFFIIIFSVSNQFSCFLFTDLFWLLSSARPLPQGLDVPDLRSLGNRAVHLM